MSGKSLQQLSTTELRGECTSRGLSISGSKSDIIIRLEEFIRESGQDPANVRFHPVQSASNTQTDGTGEQPYATSTMVGTDASWVAGQPPTANTACPSAWQLTSGGGSGHGKAQPTSGTNVPSVDVFKTAAAQLQMLQQTPPQNRSINAFEARLSALEASMANFMTEIRSAFAQQPPQQVAARSPVTPPPVQVVANTREYDQSGKSNTNGAGNALPGASYAVRTDYQHVAAHNTHGDMTGRTGNMSAYTPYEARTREPSVLIPSDDLQVARNSLTEFDGLDTDDPVWFIDNTESVLEQTRLITAGWWRAVEPQLKGKAGEWFRSRKALRLSWAEFRTEFLQKFNSTQIQSQLRADIVSVRQTPGQTLSDFVLIKNQQAHRVYTSLSEADLVGTIVELSLDKYCTQLILHPPTTFSELRRVADVLDRRLAVTKPPPESWPNSQPRNKWAPNRGPKPKAPKDTPQKPPPVKKQYYGNSFDEPPPGPCKYCGELHWNSRCPHRPTRPGNGGGVDGD